MSSPNTEESSSTTRNNALTGFTYPIANPSLNIQQYPQNSGGGGGAASTSQASECIIIIETREQFENILKEEKDKFILVEFYASWCGSCKMLHLRLEELAEKYKERLVVLKIDVDTFEELAIEYDVRNMPGFVMIRNKETLEQFAGSKEELLQNIVEKYLGKSN